MPFLVSIGSIFSKKLKHFKSGRTGLLQKAAEAIKPGKPIIWFHCASVGEFEQARPLIEEYRRSADVRILVTFFSPSGYELRKNYSLADWVFYLPIDTPRNAREFVRIVNPSKVIFIKYDLWYNFLSAIKKQGAELYLASAIFRDFQPFFSWYGGFFRKMLGFFTSIFVQDEESKTNLEQIGINENVYVTGDTRFDRVHEITGKSKNFPVIENFIGEEFTIVAGSSWPQDEQMIASVLRNFSRIKLVVAPHEINAERIEKVTETFKQYGTLLFSDLTGTADSQGKKSGDTAEATKSLEAHDSGADAVYESRVLVIDCLGILSSIYRYADFAYIGGGFGAGIHNILEAATYGCPVAFGPNCKKFKEATDLIKLGGATCTSDINDLYSIIDNCVKDKELRTWKGNICKTYVEEHLGATARIMTRIEPSTK